MPIVFDAEVAHAEETKTKEQQMSSVNEITTVNHATYFTANVAFWCVCRSCVAISWPIISKRDVILKTGNT